MWAVLSDPKGRFGGWDEAEFFRTGQLVVDEVMSTADPAMQNDRLSTAPWTSAVAFAG